MEEDVQLWRDFLKGDKQSLEAIYKRFYRNLYEYGIRKINDEELVRDCIQDLFVRLWSNKSRIGTVDNVRYYLLAAIKNNLTNARIKQTSHRIVSIEEADPFQLDFDAATTRPFLQQDESYERLRKAMNQLTARQKEIIYLHYFEELSYDQIATLMDISTKGIYKLNARALDALKDLLNLSDRKELLLLLATCKLLFWL